MRIAKISPLGSPWMAFDADCEINEILETIRDLLPEIASGEEITIEISEMNEEEFKNLPEFPGW